MRLLKTRNLIHRLMATILCSMLLLVGFSGEAKAVRYDLYTDTYSGITLFYVDTTTTSATVTIGGYTGGGYGDYYGRSTVLKGLAGGSYWVDILGAGMEANWGSPVPILWSSKTIMSTLQPGTTYTLTDQATNSTLFYFALYNGSPWIQSTFTVTTEPNAPTSPTFSNITQTSVTVNWTKNSNGDATRYVLYRSLTASGPFTYLTTGSGIFYADSGLSPNTTYYYLVSASAPGSSEKFATITPVTTAQDPAVAAATASKVAAENAQLASEAAKTAAQDAKVSSDAILARFGTMETKVDQLLVDKLAPVISQFTYGTYKATLTRQDVNIFNIVAKDDKSIELQYRYKINNDPYTGWGNLTGDTIPVSLGAAPGLKRVTVEVKDTAGNVTSATTGIFKL